MEFVGPGVANLSADFRIGVDVMTTETTCLSSIWTTDEKIREFYEIHGREADYKELKPGKTAYYDGIVEVDLSRVKPMIAMPFHPSNTYTIEEVNANLTDILADVEKRAKVSLGGAVDYSLTDKVRDGKFYVEQGIIAGCAGGGFENICDAADILAGASIGNGRLHPQRIPGQHAGLHGTDQERCGGEDLMETGAVLKTRILRPLLRRGRYAGQQCVQYPSFHQELPQPGGHLSSRAARSLRWPLWMRVPSRRRQSTRAV